jgi:hypothetical protein
VVLRWFISKCLLTLRGAFGGGSLSPVPIILAIVFVWGVDWRSVVVLIILRSRGRNGRRCVLFSNEGPEFVRLKAYLALDDGRTFPRIIVR